MAKNPKRVEEGDQLKAAVALRDMTYRQLAKLISTEDDAVTQDIVAQMAGGISRISDERKARIAAAMKLSVDQIWGTGAQGGATVSGRVSGNVLRLEETEAFTASVAIPRWRSALAGYDSEESDFQRDGYAEVPVAFLVGGRSQIDRHDLVTVSGNSLAPRVNSGEALVIYRDSMLYRNSIVLAQCTDNDGTRVYVKALRSVNGQWQLHSINKAEGDDFVDLSGWQIFGYAVARFGDDADEEGFNVEWRNGRPLRALLEPKSSGLRA
jgi:SOS-response transcriptional repressor LexA